MDVSLRELHYFPTRRSSDLPPRTDHAAGTRRGRAGHRLRGRGQNGGCGVRLHGGRSEEHTSELQSRGHLVCRLLLEKIKDYTKGDEIAIYETINQMVTLIIE